MIDPETPPETPPAEPPATPPMTLPAEPPATPPAAPPAAQPPAVNAGALTEEQWVALETQTGVKRQKIMLDMAFQQAAINQHPAIKQAEKVVERNAFNDAKTSLPGDFQVFEKEIQDELAKPGRDADRKDAGRITSIYYEIKGRKMTESQRKGNGVTQPFSRRPSPSVITPSNHGDIPPANQDGDLTDLGDDERHLAARYGIKTKKEWNENQERDIDTSFEQNWKPKFG